MISTAKITYVDGSPQKARLVANLIRGKKVGEAQTILKFIRKRHARDFLKLLNSAIANATSKNDKLDPDNLFVEKVLVNGASLRMRRRIQARAMGRAFRIVRRQSHILIVLDEIRDKR